MGEVETTSQSFRFNGLTFSGSVLFVYENLYFWTWVDAVPQGSEKKRLCSLFEAESLLTPRVGSYRYIDSGAIARPDRIRLHFKVCRCHHRSTFKVGRKHSTSTDIKYRQDGSSLFGLRREGSRLLLLMKRDVPQSSHQAIVEKAFMRIQQLLDGLMPSHD